MALDYKFLRCIWLICLCLCDYHCKLGSMKKGHLSSVKSWLVCSNSLTFFSLLIPVFNLLAVTWPTPCHELTCIYILLRKSVATVSVTASSRRTRTNFLRGTYSTYILNIEAFLYVAGLQGGIERALSHPIFSSPSNECKKKFKKKKRDEGIFVWVDLG